MELEYKIRYTATNTYNPPVSQALWQFLILPLANDSQKITDWGFNNTAQATNNGSFNGLGFRTIQVRMAKNIASISFEFHCSLLKSPVNPFDFIPNLNVNEDYKFISHLKFRVEHEVYLRLTPLTRLPDKHKSIFDFDCSKSIFQNLQDLNHWVFIHLYFKTGVTHVNTPLQEIIEKRHGVCQDFTHLFCAIAKQNGVPVRYVSGYIHQGNNYFGDSQMHAWAEAYVPNGGWIGFDPTNDVLVAENHIKVCHGKDYTDCAPLKGVVYGKGSNETNYTVKVQSSQQQQ